MRTHHECIPCLVRHAHELAEENLPAHARDDFVTDIRNRIGRFDFDNPPPIFAMEMYGVLKRMTGTDDPYAEHKARYNRKALALYPLLEKMISGSADPLDTALRIAVAGNIIDFGVHDKSNIEIEETVQASLQAVFFLDHTEELKERLKRCRRVLYIADNAGEIVMDRLFIEQIGPKRVTCAVRSAPIINDATKLDAAQSGLDKVCTVIGSGSKASGTPLSLCNDEFGSIFVSSDVVIAKGQGNFETLTSTGRDVFHLLMAKCPVIARETGAPLGSFLAVKKG